MLRQSLVLRQGLSDKCAAACVGGITARILLAGNSKGPSCIHPADVLHAQLICAHSLLARRYLHCWCAFCPSGLTAAAVTKSACCSCGWWHMGWQLTVSPAPFCLLKSHKGELSSTEGLCLRQRQRTERSSNSSLPAATTHSGACFASVPPPPHTPSMAN